MTWDDVRHNVFRILIKYEYLLTYYRILIYHSKAHKIILLWRIVYLSSILGKLDFPALFLKVPSTASRVLMYVVSIEAAGQTLAFFSSVREGFFHIVSFSEFISGYAQWFLILQSTGDNIFWTSFQRLTSINTC